MRSADSNPYRPPAEFQPAVASQGVRLNWAGRLIVCLAFVFGVAVFAYAGVLAGSIIGLERGVPHLTAPPTKGVGLAPDLSGLANAAIEFTVATVLAVSASVVAGVAITATGCWLVLAPALRKVRGLTTI
jgi:hypothetical protein